MLTVSVVNVPAAGVEPPTIPSIGPTNSVEVIDVAAETVPRLLMVVPANVEFCPTVINSEPLLVANLM